MAAGPSGGTGSRRYQTCQQVLVEEFVETGYRHALKICAYRRCKLRN
jgi:hypothetical protein